MPTFNGTPGNDVINGTAVADIINGRGGMDTLSGLGGKDTLKGGTANDVLAGGVGADFLDGGTGIDRLSYVLSAAGVRVVLGKNGAETIGKGGEAKGDHIKKIEEIVGSTKPDVLTGNNLANILIGNDGSDVLKGAAGIDTLLGDAGNDTIIGGAGADIIDGGSHFFGDTLSYLGSKTLVLVTLGDNGALTIGQLGDAQGDQISNIENLIGGAFDDALFGNNLSNTLNGSAGNDALLGKAGIDLLIGGKGADSIDGGADEDTVDYFSSSTGVKVVLGVGGSQTTGQGGDAQGDEISNVENVQGSNFNDVLVGNELQNNLIGNGGNDILYGGASGDFMHGGRGIDTLIYDGSTGVTVTLGLNGSIALASGGHADGDTGVLLDNISGSIHDDILTGNDLANTLDGGSGGEDTLFGQGGNDVLFGGDEIDSLFGGTGKDRLVGGDGDDGLAGGTGADAINGEAGIDTVVYGVSSAGVTVTLGKNGRETVGKGGEAQGDAIKSVENIQGSFVHNDKLTGNNLGNVFFGMGGNDTLSGGGGNDDLFGGNGNDKLIGGKANDFLEGGAGNDSFVFGPGFGQDNVTDFVAGAGTDDVLRFDKDVFKNFAAVLASSTQDGADVVITKGSNLVKLLNVQLADLSPDDFSFF